MEPLLLPVEEAARLLGLGRTKVFALLAVRELPVVRIGRSVRIPREALEQWIRERTEDGLNEQQPQVESGSYAISGASHAFKPRPPEPGS